jgi:hypothetical protein
MPENNPHGSGRECSLFTFFLTAPVIAGRNLRKINVHDNVANTNGGQNVGMMGLQRRL